MTMTIRNFDSTPIASNELTIARMRREFKQRATSLDLQCDCLMDGDTRAEIAIIAEAPGSREVQMGTPLIGSSGTQLWNALRKACKRQGDETLVTRNKCYITNVTKMQLALVSGKRTLSESQLQLWQALLTWELAQLPNLRYILVLGDYALRSILGEHGITLWAGSVVEHGLDVYDKNRSVTVCCTYNPAFVLREPKNEVKFILDLNRFVTMLRGRFVPHVIDMSRINPTPREAIEWCGKMLDDSLPVSLDIETMGNETACIGLGNDSHSAMCINFRTQYENRWSVRDERQVRRAIQRVIDNTQLVTQNGNFDAYWLWFKDRMRVPRIWFDTMLAHHTMYALLPHSLAFLTAQYTTHPYYKDDGKSWRDSNTAKGIDDYWRYNICDVAITYAVHLRLLDELRQQNLESFFFDHVMRLDPHLQRMTVGGVLIDVKLKQRLAEEMQTSTARLLEEFKEKAREVTGERDLDVNPRSSPQLKALFYDQLNLRSRNFDVRKETRKQWQEDVHTSSAARSLLDALDAYKTEDTFLTRYVNAKIDYDDRMRCEWKQTGVNTAPGRLSSAQVRWGSGGNLQNQPERAYEIFTADPSYTFVYFDLSQAEARVVAYLANIEKWKEQFERARLYGDYDCHRALASEMFNVPYDDVPTKDRLEDGTPTLRFISKRCRHGLNYRMQPSRLALTTGLLFSVAQEAYTVYHRATPELRTWWGATMREVQEKRVLVSPMGRPLRFFGRLDDDALDSIIAFRPQSTIGDKVKQVIYQSHDDANWPYDAAIVLNLHDALIALVPEKKAVKCLRIMKRYAEQPIIINGEPLIIPAECKIAKRGEDGVSRWSTLEPISIK